MKMDCCVGVLHLDIIYIEVVSPHPELSLILPDQATKVDRPIVISMSVFLFVFGAPLDLWLVKRWVCNIYFRKDFEQMSGTCFESTMQNVKATSP